MKKESKDESDSYLEERIKRFPPEKVLSRAGVRCD